MDFTDRKGITASLVVAIVVIVGVVAAGGIYLATQSGGGTPSSTTQTTTQSATQPMTTTTTTNQPMTTTTTTTQPMTTTTTTTSQPMTTATTTSCSTTYTSMASTTPALTVQSVLPFFQAASAMEVVWNGTGSGSGFNFTGSYQVVSAITSGGVTTYKVDINYVTNGNMTESGTAWLQSNGNVIAVNAFGQNLTGSQGSSLLVAVMAPFLAEANFDNQAFLYMGSYFHSAGTSSVTLGPTTMQVTNYAANNLPETYTECGYTGTLNTFTAQIGTVPGTSLTLVTLVSFSGTENGNQGSFTLRVVSITKA